MDYSAFIAQLDSLLGTYNSMLSKAEYNDQSDLPKADRQSLVTRCVGAIDRITGPRSTYSADVQRLIKQSPALHVHMPVVLGVVQALRDDLQSGYLQNLTETVHAEVFSDFLDMARYLNDAGYKDPAAVIAGSTLESHLRGLATKNSLPVNDTNGNPIKADRLNADLAKASVYGILDQKSITAFLDLRNKAAHGKYSEYNKDQVTNLISGVTDFINRTPA